MIKTKEDPRFAKLNPRLQDIAWWFISVGLFVGLWELGSAMGWVDEFLFPPPHRFIPLIFDSPKFQPYGIGFQGIEDQIAFLFLPRAIGATSFRVIGGMFVGFILGTLFGFLIHYQRWFGYISLPTFRLMASVSAVAWFPLIIALLRNGELTALALVALAVFFPVTLAVSETVKSVQSELIHVAKILGADRWHIFLNIILPNSLPRLYTIMRLNFYGAWMTILLSELFDVRMGLGVFIFLSRSYLNAELAWVAIFIIGVVGYTLDLILRQIGRRLFWYHFATTAENH